MSNRKTVVAASVPVGDYFAKQMKDPEYAEAYEELALEFEIVSQIISRRLELKLSQRELAERMGIPQPGLARMQSTRAIKNLDNVRRIAEALDCTVEVKLVPKKNGGKLAASKSAKTPSEPPAGAAPRRAAKKTPGNSAASISAGSKAERKSTRMR